MPCDACEQDRRNDFLAPPGQHRNRSMQQDADHAGDKRDCEPFQGVPTEEAVIDLESMTEGDDADCETHHTDVEPAKIFQHSPQCRRGSRIKTSAVPTGSL